MALKSKKPDVDSLICYLFLKKLMIPIYNMPAYKMGLIDSSGRVKKAAESAEELEAWTLLDQLVVKLKGLLGTRLSTLYQFLYLQSLNSNLYNNVVIAGSVGQRAEIKRVATSLKRMNEDVKMDDLAYGVLIDSFVDMIEAKEILEV